MKGGNPLKWRLGWRRWRLGGPSFLFAVVLWWLLNCKLTCAASLHHRLRISDVLHQGERHQRPERASWKADSARGESVFDLFFIKERNKGEKTKCPKVETLNESATFFFPLVVFPSYFTICCLCFYECNKHGGGVFLMEQSAVSE